MRRRRNQTDEPGFPGGVGGLPLTLAAASCSQDRWARFHFHDLRHTGNTLAAASGASTRELMHRMGHASMRAALIYQHATSQRDREIVGNRITRPSDKKPTRR